MGYPCHKINGRYNRGMPVFVVSFFYTFLVRCYASSLCGMMLTLCMGSPGLLPFTITWWMIQWRSQRSTNRTAAWIPSPSWCGGRDYPKRSNQVWCSTVCWLNVHLTDLIWYSGVKRVMSSDVWHKRLYAMMTKMMTCYVKRLITLASTKYSVF